MTNITPELRDAILLLKAWTRSEWKDFIKDDESPLMYNTKKFLEQFDESNRRPK